MNKGGKLCAVWMGILSCVESFGVFHLAYILALHWREEKKKKKAGHNNKVLSHHCCLVRSHITHYMCMMNWRHYAQLKWLFSSSDLCCHLNNMMLGADTGCGCSGSKCTIKNTHASRGRIYGSSTVMLLEQGRPLRSTAVENLEIIINVTI